MFILCMGEIGGIPVQIYPFIRISLKRKFYVWVKLEGFRYKSATFIKISLKCKFYVWVKLEGFRYKSAHLSKYL